MPVLIYQNHDGQRKEYAFTEETSIGSDPQRCQIVLPAELGVAPCHAIIMRSTLTRAPILVNLAGPQTWVNERPIVGIQTLRQRDTLRLAQARLSLCEVRIICLEAGNRSIGRECQICTDTFEEGQQVIYCPHCELAYHRECWLQVVGKCANFDCGYNSFTSIVGALRDSTRFEFNLSESSPLVEIKGEENLLIQEGRRCLAGQRRDRVAFQVGNHVAYCPNIECRTPYHLDCWLIVGRCTACDYNIQELIDQALTIPSEQSREEATTDGR